MTAAGRVLLTGAAGFIGSHTCQALIERGHEVIGMDNFDAFYARSIKEANLATLRSSPAFRFVEGDVTRDELPLQGVQTVVHFAARPGVRPSLVDPAGYIEANVNGTVRVLEACRRQGIQRVVFASSSSVYGDTTEPPFRETEAATEPISPYAASKRAAELVAYAFVHLYQLRVICLRFFTVYGPRQRPDLAIHRFTDLIARGMPVPFHGDGSSERDYTYITDALDGILASLDWTGRETNGAWEAVNIGGGSRVRLDRLIELISTALGRPANLNRLPNQPGDVRLTAAGLEHAERLLGYRPRVGIEEGIGHFVRWYEETHGR
jgi:UDP-glucuronate 4-epimerase